MEERREEGEEKGNLSEVLLKNRFTEKGLLPGYKRLISERPNVSFTKSDTRGGRPTRDRKQP